MMQERRSSLARGTVRPSPGRLVVACALLALLPAASLVVIPSGLALLLSPRTGIVLATGILVAPGLVLPIGAWRIRRTAIPAFAGEFRRALWRLAVAVLFILYTLAYAMGGGASPVVLPSLVIAALGLACAWLVLLQTGLSPAVSTLRRQVVGIGDIALVSALIHAGGPLAAPCVALYPAIAVAEGLEYGLRALIAAAALCTAGFAIAAATAGFWREVPTLAVAAATVIALIPAQLGLGLKRYRRQAEDTAAADAAEGRALAAAGDEVRRSLKTLLDAASAFDRGGLSPEQSDRLARVRLSARAALMQADAIPTYLAVTAGDFAPETRGFDLYQLIHGTVAALRPQAIERGVALSVRIDPRLPYELRGWPHQLRQVLAALVASTVRRTDRATVAVTLDLVELLGDGVRFTLAVAEHGPRAVRTVTASPAAVAADAERPELVVAESLSRLMGGTIEAAAIPRGGNALSVDLTFAIDRAALALAVDLDGLPVFIASEDQQLVRELIEALAAWHAVGCWIGAGDEALAQVAALPAEGERSAVIVDGRGEVLPALSWAHRAGRANPAAAPYLLFIADEARIGSVVGLADTELDAILSAPFTPGVLQSTLHALRVGTADWFPTEPLPVASVLPPRPAPAQAAAAPPAVIMPRVEPERTPPDQPSLLPPPRPRRDLRVLVVASNAANRRIMERILRTAGHAATLVADDEQAVEALATQPVDLVLIDLAGADGEAVETCREADPEVPIIVLAGADVAAEWPATVLIKPVEPSRLLAAIDTIYPPPPLDLAPDAEASAEPAPLEEAAASVTEISSHPRFARGSGVVDERAVDALVSLGAGSGFFDDVVDSFHADARQWLKELGGAAAIGDAAGYAAAVQALRNCTASFGGARLRELLAAMQQIGPAELRLKGPALIQRLGAELDRLEATLAAYRQTR